MRRLLGIAGPLGTAGTLVSTVATLSCCGPAVLGPASGVLAAAVAWLPGAAQYPVLYASLALTLLAVGASAGRDRCAWPVVLAVPGVLAVVLALHEAWDVGTFRALIWGGSAALVTAGLSGGWSRVRGCRRGPGGPRGGCAT